MSDYKELNLDRDTLDERIQEFLNLNNYQRRQVHSPKGTKRVVFGHANAEFALVDIHLKTTGTATIQWKTGRNQPLGETLAMHLKSTIDPNELETLNYSLKGISIDSFDPILDCITEQDEIELNVRQDSEQCKQVTLKNKIHQDKITLTHHKKTSVLQIQGRPLSCYRRVIFMLTDLLDLKGLEQVLYRNDDSSAGIVRSEMAEDYLKTALEQSYEHLPDAIKKLLISGCCVKLASPSLPDYCLLLYPDLRALEGVLKEIMSKHNMFVSNADHGFGDFFDKNHSNYSLKSEYCDSINNSDLENALNNGYTFYKKHRHSLFHMEDFADASRMVDTLDKAIGLSKDTYSAINKLYSSVI